MGTGDRPEPNQHDRPAADLCDPGLKSMLDHLHRKSSLWLLRRQPSLKTPIRKHDQTKERLFQQPLIRQDYIRGAGAFCVNGGNASNGAITASMFGQRPRSKPRRRAAHRLRKLEDSGDRRPTGESESSLPAPRYQSLDRFELFKAEVRHYISVVRYRYTDTQRQQSQPRLLQPQGRAPAARQVR